MAKDLIMNGIRVANDSFEPQEIKELIQKRCIDEGMNYVSFTIITGTVKEDEHFLDVVRFLKENNVYFDVHFKHPTRNKGGTIKTACGYNAETVDKIKEIAGENFVSHELAELGSEFGCYAAAYKEWLPINSTDNDACDMRRASVNLFNKAKTHIEEASIGGKVPVTVIEATALMPYIAKAGLSYPCLEAMCGNSDIMIPITRATAKLVGSDIWASYIAHEWYGGVRAFDQLKMHRLRMIYDYLYMSGANIFVLESGDEELHAHDTPRREVCDENGTHIEYECEYDHPMCRKYREIRREFADFVNQDERPKGGPKVKVAFVQGNFDGFSPWRAGSSLWNCFENPDFGYSSPEFMWRIFDDIFTKRQWHDIHNFGEIDLSGAPAYGTYDIVFANSGYEIFSKYDYLIFTGWNTMTDEIYENLKKFVQGGGRLFMTAAHLNTTIKRNGEIKLIRDGDVSDLFGCKLSVQDAFETNDGYKFFESTVPEFMYPRDMFYDPIFSEGYLKYAKAELQTATAVGVLSRRFLEKDEENLPVWLAENKLGEGYAVLMTSLDYPSGSGFSAYKCVVREMLTASHRAADIKVYGSDKIRFTVYEGDKVYLLNTDFDCKSHAVIDYGEEKREFILNPREILAVDR